mmetsp:Transcript_42315/g.104233  ORF Transcript_42315/g.104233 Transcript_42315/m.104233 type:complete len:153 (-) Transcript_42315:53-511(-)
MNLHASAHGMDHAQAMRLAQSPLLVAIAKGQVDKARKRLKGPGIDETADVLILSLYTSAELGYAPIVQLLLAKGADPAALSRIRRWAWHLRTATTSAFVCCLVHALTATSRTQRATPRCSSPLSWESRRIWRVCGSPWKAAQTPTSRSRPPA